VRVSVQVGARAKGGFEGELDVVAINFPANHLLHVECSLDALSAEKREPHFKAKFDRGRRYIKEVFRGQSRSRKSAQGDKWSFCLTAGTVCPANQERR
jgi:hypothetical protein